MVYFKKFKVTGDPNAETLDDGLKSTQSEKKRLLSVIIQTSGYKDNTIHGYLETTKIIEVPDSLLDTTEQFTDTNEAKSYNRLNELEVGIDMPIGATFKIGILCGATGTNLVGAYRYEVIT